jgi:pyruvate/2-oxoglutarate dehydrogenase complex dihydrolipoamide dehydrogenase (E3) component
MSKVSRAIEKSETSGFMKVIVDAETRRILGAAVLGTGGDEVIHSILDVMYAEAPYSLIQRRAWTPLTAHPSKRRALPFLAQNLRLNGPLFQSRPSLSLR